MEHFENLKKKDHHDGKGHSTSAMNYNGIWIEDIIDGYYTLKVEGREMLAPEVEIQNTSVGAIVSSQRIPSRTLKVTFKLENHNPDLLLIDFRNLVNELYTEEDVPIYFNDERDVFYCGRFSGASEVDGASYEVVSDFEITCADPRRYSQAELFVDGVVNKDFRYNQRPSRIELKLARNGKVSVTNTQQTITIDNDLSVNDSVVIDFDEGKILVNDQNKTSYLSLTSDFENFILKKGQIITSSNGTCKTYFREVTF